MHISHSTFTIVCHELCPYIEKQVTNGSYIFVKSINNNIFNPQCACTKRVTVVVSLYR